MESEKYLTKSVTWNKGTKDEEGGVGTPYGYGVRGSGVGGRWTW